MISYQEASKRALNTHQVGHLSNSSVSRMSECYNKWYLGKFYNTPNINMSGGQIFHSLKEHVQKDIMTKAVEGVEITDAAMYADRYAVAKKEILAVVDIPDLITRFAYEEYDNIMNNPSEILTDLRAFKRDFMERKDLVIENFTLDHLDSMVCTPALGVEFAVTWIDDVSGVKDAPPYLGYVDELWYDHTTDTYVICDLKSHWRAPTVTGPIGASTLFQAWLYAKALLQMGKIPPDRRIIFEVKRVVCKFGKKKSEISAYNHFFTKNGEPLNLNDSALDEKMYNKIRNVARKLELGIKDYAGSAYGCNSCDYVGKCDKAILPEWSDQKVEEETT